MVLAFFASAWLSLLVILLAAPDVYARALGTGGAGVSGPELLFLAVIVILLAVLGLGTVRRWRWTFWLILIAFILGILRIPAAVLELTGVLPAGGPGWYVIFQAAVGAVQFLIALSMLSGYRRGGPWAA
jgi:multisubunit Na+/H+ antiporter MnhG subunit